jgi:hypothetical protein
VRFGGGGDGIDNTAGIDRSLDVRAPERVGARLDSAGSANSQSSVTEVEDDSCPPKEFIGLRNGGRKKQRMGL